MTTIDAIKNKEATLIDVREPHELDIDGAVEGALNIPLGDVPHNVDEIKEMSKPLVLFCRSGQRSAKAVEFLQNQGLEDLFNGGGFANVNNVLNSEE